ncbi:hypothetical protein CBS101457_004391 [Exobasidium rhododendri]|nr:hypothetical protein CBS101457_004391 [Exobasidium rhododendri]
MSSRKDESNVVGKELRTDASGSGSAAVVEETAAAGETLGVRKRGRPRKIEEKSLDEGFGGHHTGKVPATGRKSIVDESEENNSKMGRRGSKGRSVVQKEIVEITEEMNQPSSRASSSKGKGKLVDESPALQREHESVGASQKETAQGLSEATGRARKRKADAGSHENNADQDSLVDQTTQMPSGSKHTGTTPCLPSLPYDLSTSFRPTHAAISGARRAKGTTTPLNKFPSKCPPRKEKAKIDAENEVLRKKVIDQVESVRAKGVGGLYRCSISPSPAEANDGHGTGQVMKCFMGPITDQAAQSLPLRIGRPLAGLVNDKGKKGSLLNAGGYVYSLDWLQSSGKAGSARQHLCIAASLEEDPLTLIGERLTPISSPSAAELQIWSIDDEFEAKLQLILRFKEGRVSCVRWLPTSSIDDKRGGKLGLLSACMQDGSVGIYAVPLSDVHQQNGSTEGEEEIGGGGEGEKEAPTLRLSPILSLNVNKGVALCMAWCNADKLAIAYSDGWVSIWSLSRCLGMDARKIRPLIYAKVSASPITSISWDTSGRQVFVSAYDGSARCMQLSHPHASTEIYHSRDVCYAIEYSEALGAPLMERPEVDDVRSVDFVNGKFHIPHLYSHLGRVRTMSVSTLHPFVASGGADGSVRVLDSGWDKRANKGKKNPIVDVVMTVFRLDRHRTSGDFRMIENLALLPTSYKEQHQKNSSSAWDPAICLTATRWNPNEGREGWLASGLACGLVRIDVVSSPPP